MGEPSVGKAATSDHPRSIGKKFDPDGNLLRFPGCTVICHLAQDSALYRALLEMYDGLQKQEFSHLYALLPPTSWHMTVFEGVCDQVRVLGQWPADLPLDAPLSDCTALLGRKLRDFDLAFQTPFKMAVVGFEPLLDGIGLKVRPVDEAGALKLRQLRDRLSAALQIRYPVHDTYSLHISISYMLRFLDDQTHDKIAAYLEGWRTKLPQLFELGALEYCLFNDMFAFHRQFYLK